MTIDEAYNNMIGLYAYDTGCISSGINDDILRDEVRQTFEAENKKLRTILTTAVKQQTELMQLIMQLDIKL